MKQALKINCWITLGIWVLLSLPGLALSLDVPPDGNLKPSEIPTNGSSKMLNEPYLTEKAGISLHESYQESSPGMDQNSMEVMTQWLNHKDVAMREMAIEGFAEIGIKKQAPAIAKRIKDKNDGIRLAAIKALGKLDAKDQTLAIVEGLADESDNVRRAAIETLVKLNAKEQIPVISGMLLDKNDDVRIAAIDALGMLGATEHTSALAKWILDENDDIRRAAIEALEKLNAKAQTPAIAEGLLDEKGDVRRAAIEALGSLDAKEQTTAIAKNLNDNDDGVRRASIKALGKLGAKEQILFIAEELESENDKLRREAILALGKLGAKDQETAITEALKDENDQIRLAAIEALGMLGAIEQLPTIADGLTDEIADIRRTTIDVLGKLGAKDQIPALIEMLNDEDDQVRHAAAITLSILGAPVDATNLAGTPETALNDSSNRSTVKVLKQKLSGSVEKVELVLDWLGSLPSNSEKSDPSSINKALSDFIRLWSDPGIKGPKIRQEMSSNIARIVKQAGPTELNTEYLAKVIALLKNDYPEDAKIIREALVSYDKSKTLFIFSKGLIGHLLFWSVLILVYPRFQSVQKFFFWNPWVRKLLGLGYIGPLLTRVPYLRHRLFLPFKENLLSDARLEEFDEAAYYRDSVVKTPDTQLRPLIKELDSIKGQVLLIGDSGVGKTFFIQQHLKQTPKPSVYIPAHHCIKSVLSAIHLKIKSRAPDKNFLKSLLHRNALDVYIDSLNETPPKIFVKIHQFAEEFSQTNLLLSSQPMKWLPPDSVRTLELQPLNKTRIEAFLSTRPLSGNMRLGQAEYKQRVQYFLTRLFSEADTEASLKRICAVLSNPFDLSLIAEMLAMEKVPNIYNFHQQYIDGMVQDYADGNGGKAFPMSEFAENIYTIRKQNDRVTKLRENWALELDYLAKHRMMFRREVNVSKTMEKKVVTRWYFRHEKIQDLFLSNAFFESSELQNKHMGDARFRGVYFYLARSLPLESAINLRDRLIRYAADNSDHTVSDFFIHTLLSRPDWNNKPTTDVTAPAETVVQ